MTAFKKTASLAGAGVLAGSLLGALAGCSDVERAKNAADFSDKPAYVKCTTIGGSPMYEGWSAGRVIYDDGGRLTFTDGKDGRVITTEGECIVTRSK